MNGVTRTKFKQRNNNPEQSRPFTPEELATLIPKKYQPLIRAENPLSKAKMEALGQHLELIDDPLTKRDALRRHLRAIHDDRLFLALDTTYSGFLTVALGWNDDKIKKHLQVEHPLELSAPSPTPPEPDSPATPSKPTAPSLQDEPESRAGDNDKPALASEQTEDGSSAAPTDPPAPAAGLRSPPESAPQEASFSQIPVPEAGAHTNDVRQVSLAILSRPEALRVRAKTDKKTVGEYAQLMKDGVDLGPIVVFEVDGQLVIADGNHRFEAAKLAGYETISCIVRQGTVRDALQFALSANAKRGVRLTNADKRRCAEIALREFPEWSSHLIAEKIGASHTLVDKVRKQLATDASSDLRVGKDGKRRKKKASTEKADRHQAEDPPSEEEAPVEKQQSTDEQPTGDPGSGEASSSDDGTAEDEGESGEGAPAFDPKAKWLQLRQHLLSVLNEWPEDHRSYLGDQLCAFVDKYCPED